MRPAPSLETQWASLLLSLAAHQPRPESADPQPAGGGQAAVPVAILTGFLGSGKSTLLARLLSDPGPGDGPVRAVVNDVGGLAFDPTLVASADAGRVELTNGCGCCVAGAADELGQALDRAAPGARLLILEASGLADPAAVAQVVAARPGLRVERTVAVVDVRAVDQLRAMPGPAAVLGRQLDRATAIVASHADGLSDGERDRAVERLAGLAPGRPITISTLDAPAHRTLTPDALPGAALAGPPVGAPGLDLVVATVEQEHRAISRRDLYRVLSGRPAGLLRGKGRLRLDDDSHALVQFTPSRIEIAPTYAGVCALTLVAIDWASLDPVAALLGLAGPAQPGID